MDMQLKGEGVSRAGSQGGYRGPERRVTLVV